LLKKTSNNINFFSCFISSETKQFDRHSGVGAGDAATSLEIILGKFGQSLGQFEQIWVNLEQIE